MNNHKLFFLRDKIYLVNFFSCFDFFYKLLHVGGATVSSSRVTALLLFWLNYACFVSSSPFCNLTKTAKQLSSKIVDHIIKEADKVYQKSVFTWNLSHSKIFSNECVLISTELRRWTVKSHYFKHTSIIEIALIILISLIGATIYCHIDRIGILNAQLHSQNIGIIKITDLIFSIHSLKHAMEKN